MSACSLAIRLGQNWIPLRSIAGTSKNIGSDGMMYQKVASIWEAICVSSPVSRHNQMTAMMEIKGSDATSAPNAGLRFATSETKAASSPDKAALIAKYNISGLSGAGGF